MRTKFQAFNWLVQQKIFAGVLLGGLAAGGGLMADDGLSRNVAVLVDVSKSVDIDNQKSALTLVANLVSGEMDEDNGKKWKFKPKPVDNPAIENLRQLHDGNGKALASDPARFVVCPLGNYPRVEDLRKMLQRPSIGHREEICQALLAGGFGATDNYTHLTLAKAVAAEALLEPESTERYYLIVVSDGFEDLFNMSVADYRNAEENEKLKIKNAIIINGEALPKGEKQPGTTYSAPDREAIKYFAKKIEEADLGEFTYQEQVADPDKKEKVRVSIYALKVKAALDFEKTQTHWLLPTDSPTLTVKSVGLFPETLVTVRVAKDQKPFGTEKTERFDKILAQNQLKVSDYLGDFPEPGSYSISLGVLPGGGDVSPSHTVTVAVPKLRFKDSEMDKMAAPTEPAAHDDVKAFKFRSSWKITDGIPMEVDPDSSGEICAELDGYLLPNGNDPKVRNLIQTEKSKEVAAESMKKVADDQNVQWVLLKVWLKYSGNTSEKDKYLEEKTRRFIRVIFPNSSIRVVPTAGVTVIKDSDPEQSDPKEPRMIKPQKITLSPGGGVKFTLYATYETVQGMDWGVPKVTKVIGGKEEPVSAKQVLFGGKNNKFDFSKQDPGTYRIYACFGTETDRKVGQNPNIEVTFARKTPWLLIAMGAILVTGLGFFGWYFFRRD